MTEINVDLEESQEEKQVLTPEEMAGIERAQKLGATPITTEKDHPRLPKEVRAKIKVIKIGIEWEDCDAREAILKKVIENGQ